MPRLLPLKVPALARMAHDLRFAPKAAARRQTERCEKLAGMIDPAGVYPEDFVVYQITGFRPEMAEPELLPGEALLGGLAGLLDRLSQRAVYSREELASPGWLTMEDLLARWKVSRKTIERLRTRGLLARRVVLARGRGMNVYSRKLVENVERREGLAEGGRSKGRKVNGDDASIKARTKKVRLSERGRKVAQRAVRVGVSPGQVSKRVGTSVATVHRLPLRALAERCRGVRVAVPAGAAEVIAREGDRFLRDDAARRGLGRRGALSIAEFVAEVLRGGAGDPQCERAMAFAYWTLVERAQRGAREVNRTRPSSSALDRVVTDLRWAALLKVELVRCEQRLMLRTIQVQTGFELQEHAPADGAALLTRCLAALSGAVDRFDPTVGRLAGVAGLELSRTVSRWMGEREGRKGVAVGVERREGVLEDWTRGVASWQAWLEPSAALLAGAERLEGEDRDLLVRRYGLMGEAPADFVELSLALGKPVRVIARLVKRAERAAVRPMAGQPKKAGRKRGA